MEARLDINTLDRSNYTKVNEFVEQNVNLVRKVAYAFKNSVLEFEDLIQIGLIGMYNAVMRFDQTRGLKFSTYAVPMIQGEIKRFLRDKAQRVKIPRDLYGIYVEYCKLRNEYNVEEIAEILKLTDEQMQEIVKMQNLIYSGSLDANVNEDSEDKETEAYNLVAGKENTEHEALSNITHREILKYIEEKLGKKARRIIEFRMNDIGQKEIGKLLGMSQVHVSRIITKIGEVVQQGFEELDVRTRTKVIEVREQRGLQEMNLRNQYGAEIEFIKDWLKANRGEPLELKKLLESNGFEYNPQKSTSVLKIVKSDLLEENYQLSTKPAGRGPAKLYIMTDEEIAAALEVNAVKDEVVYVTDIKENPISEVVSHKPMVLEPKQVKDICEISSTKLLEDEIAVLKAVIEDKNEQITAVHQELNDSAILIKALRANIKELEEKQPSVVKTDTQLDEHSKRVLDVIDLILDKENDTEETAVMLKSLATTLIALSGVAFAKGKKVKINLNLSEI